ncbi:facilitated trehalose transporter Tret1-like [Manduca sexta]|nr:facilitated trehalose transporter Tret1-like [Manduca sexta]
MERSSSTKELFTGRQYRKALIISAGLKATQILTGSVTIKEYLGPICRESNIPKYHERTVLLVFGAVTFVVGIMSTMLVDRVGRRPLLIYSYFVTGLSLVVVGAYFFLQDVIRVNHDFLAIFGFIPFLAILIANIVSTIGFNSLVSVIPAEIFPLNVKAVAMTSLNVFGGVLGFLVAKCYQNVKDLVGLTAVFWIFGTVGIVGGFFTYFVVPETKGKNLREIQLMLEGDYTAVKLNQDAVNCQVNEEVPLEEVNMNIEVKK